MPTWLRRILIGAPSAVEKVSLDIPDLGVANCKECHKLLRHHFILRLMAHLDRDHGFTDEQVQDIAVHMLELLLQHKQEMKNADTGPKSSSRIDSNNLTKHGSAR
jgi:hypothetical protein